MTASVDGHRGISPLRKSTLPRSRPERVGMYRIVAELGTGGTGTVYKAEHVLLGHPVAIKILRPELSHDPSYHELFLTEARTANRIASDAVVEVVDIGQGEGGRTFLVMELVEGWNLHALLKRRALSPYHAITIARQVCEALSHVHRGGIIHRDIKPQNIHIVERDGQRQIKLLDFGIAARLEVERDNVDVNEGILVGTPEYMAPEQARGGRLDHRCDLYAVGALLFEMLTGRPPFERKSLEQMILDVTNTKPPAPSWLAPLPESVRDELDRLVASCLAKDPRHRPATASVLVEALRELEARMESEGVPSLRDVLVPSRRSVPPRDEPPVRDTVQTPCAQTLRSAT